MPTVRPRHQITETPQVARALDLAARKWPGESRSRLVLRLMDAGTTALELERVESAKRQGEVIAAVSGKYDDAFGEDYLADLRNEWPE